MILTLADHGSRRHAALGEHIELHLDENPTTGFRWVLLPTQAVVIERDRMASTSVAPGAGGQRQLTLRVVQRGEHDVRLRCERSWEGEATAIATFALTLVVD